MKTKLSFLYLFFFLSAACLPGISLTAGSTPTAQMIIATPQPLPSSTPTPLPVAPTPNPTQPAGLDRVNIYLVAVGDNGTSGKQIGCGDSLVPVEVRIEPTMGVLRAALNELFKLEGQIMYGQSGLYNALYLSDLSISDVAVIDGEARIDLVGELIIGGVCDIPRIEEQLRTTALQFSTVNSVSISVNGVPLEDLLDLRG